MTLIIEDMCIEDFCTTNDFHLNQGKTYKFKLKDYVARYSDGHTVKTDDAYMVLGRPRYEDDYNSKLVAIVVAKDESRPASTKSEKIYDQYYAYICKYSDELFELSNWKVHLKFKTTHNDEECDCEVTADIIAVGDWYYFGYGGQVPLEGIFCYEEALKRYCHTYFGTGLFQTHKFKPAIAREDYMMDESCNKGNSKPWNDYLDLTDCADGVIFSARSGDDICTFRKCEHGNRWMIHSYNSLHEHTDMATDCEECLKKGKPFRIVPPPHPLPKIGIYREIERYGPKEHIDEHLKLNWKSRKYLWGFDTTDEASAFQEIYFKD